MYIDTLLLLCLTSAARSEARELLIWAMQDNAPYTAMTRAYLQQRTPRLAYPKQPHPYIKLQDPIERIERLIQEYGESLLNLG